MSVAATSFSIAELVVIASNAVKTRQTSALLAAKNQLVSALREKPDSQIRRMLGEVQKTLREVKAETWQEITADDVEHLARIFRKKNWAGAAEVVEKFFAGEVKMAEVADILEQAIPACGLFARPKWVAWGIRNRANNAVEEQKACDFIAPLLNAIRGLQQECIVERDLRNIESHVCRIRPADEWGGWALKALERVIAAHNGDMAHLVSQELAAEVKAAHADFRGALALVDGLHRAVRIGVETHRQANRQEKAAREEARRQRQLTRARVCQSMRGNNPGVEKHGKGKR